MNYHDHARASGQIPPEYGKCAKCKKRKEVDTVSVRGHVMLLCAECQKELGMGKNEEETFDPDKLPF